MDSGTRRQVAQDSPKLPKHSIHRNPLIGRILAADMEDVATVWQDHEKDCWDCRRGYCCEVEKALVNRLNFDLSLKNGR